MALNIVFHETIVKLFLFSVSVNMCTYQPQFISRYSRLSSILDLDTILAQQMQREVNTVVMKCLDLGVVSLCSVL